MRLMKKLHLGFGWQTPWKHEFEWRAEKDLSFNNLSGQLLSSTRSLSSLITLYGNKCSSVAISFFELRQISSSFFD
ncbi:hypothetical protein RIF29_25521 [Crotalaria pallida]|uniref:Uncharacterized protein n=1 Tax=Crotalaria pallida TaxID=3830 RepID=A0AAN9EP52_CROPI